METFISDSRSEQKKTSINEEDYVSDRGSYDGDMDETTKKMTDHLAAAVICQPGFPLSWDKKLKEPPPFTNYGYQINFNPMRYYSVIWSVVEEMTQSLPRRAKSLVFIQKSLYFIAAVSILFSFVIEST